jgi:hypothetical protein
MHIVEGEQFKFQEKYKRQLVFFYFCNFFLLKNIIFTNENQEATNIYIVLHLLHFKLNGFDFDEGIFCFCSFFISN